MSNLKIKYCDWGIANFYGTHVEINRGLSKDKRLRDYVVKHELGHKDEFDLGHEFDFNPMLPRLAKFVLLHPKTWIDFLPIQLKKGNIIFDLNLTLLYCIIISLSIFLVILY